MIFLLTPHKNSLRVNMGFSVHWNWLAALLCLLCLGDGVLCDCTEENMQILGGTYKMTKELRRGSMLIYSCPEGYYPYPATSRLCQASGTWRPVPKKFSPQRCRKVECPDPNVMEYGNVSPPQEKYFVDNETTYECYSGYKLRGSSRRICLPNGKWSGFTPICSRDTGDHCADPGIPAGATRTGNSFGIDDTVRYGCRGKLFLMGSDERTCQENGQWTGNEPACYFKYTYDTPVEVSQAFGRGIIDSLTTLESGDDIQGERKIRISKNGTLNIYIAVDVSESIEAEYVKNATDAVAKLITKISSFTVSPNYEIVFFSSDIFEVVNILDFFDGKEVKLHETLKNFKVEVESTGTDLNLVFLHFLERMAFIKQRVGSVQFKEHYHAIVVFTDGAYNMGGSPEPTVQRIKNMVYMNHTNEAEANAKSREEYLDIYLFGIGTDIYEDDLKRLETGIGEKHFFKLKEYGNLQVAFDQIIDEQQVKGLCGLHVEYETEDRDSDRKMYPWLAYVNVQNEAGRRNCLGSLVSPEFVLTAAHCFAFGDLPEHVTVQINDGDDSVKKVRYFYVHPKYNVNARKAQGVDEFYDYDVALVQLMKAVEISILARPICIPCTVETNSALKLSANANCKEQEQLLLKNHQEHLNFLTKERNGVGKKYVIAKLGDNRDECISHALKAQGITATDPKVAVTDNFLCTGGRNPERDHIACTGDSGGAVYKTYEHRAMQVALVSWGTQQMCTGGGLVNSNDNSRDFHLNLFKVVPFLKSILANDTQDDYAPLKFLTLS